MKREAYYKVPAWKGSGICGVFPGKEGRKCFENMSYLKEK